MKRIAVALVAVLTVLMGPAPAQADDDTPAPAPIPSPCYTQQDIDFRDQQIAALKADGAAKDHQIYLDWQNIERLHTNIAKKDSKLKELRDRIRFLESQR